MSWSEKLAPACSNEIGAGAISQSEKQSKLKSSSSSYSDGNLKNQENSGFKQKLVNKVKAWSCKEAKSGKNVEVDKLEDNLTVNLEERLPGPDVFTARDSLENLFNSNNENLVNCEPKEKEFSSNVRYSDSFLDANKSNADSNIKSVLWDPWNKIGRKNKKENKRRKSEKLARVCENASGAPIRLSKGKEKSFNETTVNVDEPINTEDPNFTTLDQENQESYSYPPYNSQNKRNVEFINQVMVVYFVGDEVIGKGTEPLKKELDQQIRNKEMRRGHVPCMMSINNRIGENYSAAWFKK